MHFTSPFSVHTTLRGTTLVAFVLTFLAFGATAATVMEKGVKPGEWTQDYDAARELAREQNVPVLLAFTGSETVMVGKGAWTVLSSPEFLDWARNRLVLVDIGKPYDGSEVPMEYIERNVGIRSKLRVSTYPSYYILGPDDVIRGRFSFQPGGTFEDLRERILEVAGERDGTTGARTLPVRRPPGPPTPGDIREALTFHTDDPGLKSLELFSGIVLSALDRKLKEAEQKEQAIRDQVVAALEKAKNAAQQQGDLDGVLLFMEAIKNPDATPETDNAVLTRLLAQRDAARVKVADWLKAEQAPILSSAVDRLEQMKRDETKKGNIAFAKTIDDYQKTVQSFLSSPPSKPSSSSLPKPPAASPTSGPAPTPSSTFGVGGPAAAHTISMSVDKESGTGLGRYEAGEVLVIQYVSGKYKYRHSTSYAPTNPDADERSDGTVYYYAPTQRPRVVGPLRTKNVQTWDVPKNTATKPFAILIKDPGHYEFRAFGGSSWDGTLTYKITKLSVLQAKRLMASPEKDNLQWQ